MKISKENCRNYNHGRTNPPVAYCPNCGLKFNFLGAKLICNEQKHRDDRKNRHIFCTDCGKNLNK